MGGMKFKVPIFPEDLTIYIPNHPSVL